MYIQNTKVVTTGYGQEVEVRDFIEPITQAKGVEVFTISGTGVDRLGSIIGTSIPGIEDIEGNTKFDSEVENWLIDNGY